MAEPAWLSWVGGIAGVIGAVTGIAGAILGYKGYRRADALKALDLRLELRRAEADLRVGLKSLSAHINNTNASRQAVASALGTLRTGAMASWSEQVKSDSKEVASMIAAWKNGTDHSSVEEKALESALVAVHEATTRCRHLRTKYDRELALDDKEREEIRSRHGSRR